MNDKGGIVMNITRITFRIPKDLMIKVRLIASENQISLNSELIELIRFGINYYLEKNNEKDVLLEVED